MNGTEHFYNDRVDVGGAGSKLLTYDDATAEVLKIQPHKTLELARMPGSTQTLVSGTIITYPVEVFNLGDFVDSSGTLTCQTSGLYYVNFGGGVSGATTPTGIGQLSVRIRINGTEATNTGCQATSAPNTLRAISSLCGLYSLAQGDTLDVQAHQFQTITAINMNRFILTIYKL